MEQAAIWNSEFVILMKVFALGSPFETETTWFSEMTGEEDIMMT